MKIVQSRRKIYSDTKFRRNVWSESGTNLMIDTTNNAGKFASIGSPGTSISLLNDIIPSTNNTLDLGAAGSVFANVYSQNVYVASIYSTYTNITLNATIIPNGNYDLGSSVGQFSNVYSLTVHSDSINLINTTDLNISGGISVTGDINTTGNIGSATSRIATGYFTDVDVSGTVYVGTISKTGANITLQTLTSGDIILNPAGNIVVNDNVLPNTSFINLGSATQTFNNIYTNNLTVNTIGSGTVNFTDSISVTNDVLANSVGTSVSRIATGFFNSVDALTIYSKFLINNDAIDLTIQTTIAGADILLTTNSGDIVFDANSLLPNLAGATNIGSPTAGFGYGYFQALSVSGKVIDVVSTDLQLNSDTTVNGNFTANGTGKFQGDVTCLTVTVGGTNGQTIDIARVQNWDNAASSVSGKADVDLSNITPAGLGVIDTRAEIVEEEMIYVDELLSVNLEAMFFDTFINSTWVDQVNTTATIGDTFGKGNYSGSSGQILQSTNIYFDDSGSNRNVTRVMVLMDDWTGKTVEVTADGGTTWDPVTQDTIITLASPGTDLRYKITFGTSATPIGSIAVLFDYA